MLFTIVSLIVFIIAIAYKTENYYRVIDFKRWLWVFLFFTSYLVVSLLLTSIVSWNPLAAIYLFAKLASFWPVIYLLSVFWILFWLHLVTSLILSWITYMVFKDKKEIDELKYFCKYIIVRWTIAWVLSTLVLMSPMIASIFL